MRFPCIRLVSFTLVDQTEQNVNVRRFESVLNKTSRERHESAPYLKLKNSKSTWKCQKTQSIKLTKRVSNSRKTQTTEQARQGPAKKEIISHFLTSILSQNIKKLKGGPFGEFFFQKKSHNAEKNWTGETAFSLSRYGVLRGKRGKTFLIQFARPNDSIWDHEIL